MELDPLGPGMSSHPRCWSQISGWMKGMSRCGVAVVELDPLAWEEAATPPTEANPFGAPFESPIRTPGRGSAKAVGGS